HSFILESLRPPRPPLFPYTTLFRSLLSHNPNKWTCVVFHHPIFSTKTTRDNKRMRETFKPLFDRYKVDLVLQGHDHTYARGMKKDRKSTRLNSSHVKISYAVFCLKK